MQLTTDLCDTHPEKVRVAEPIGFKDYGGLKIFSGKIEFFVRIDKFILNFILDS